MKKYSSGINITLLLCFIMWMILMWFIYSLNQGLTNKVIVKNQYYPSPNNLLREYGIDAVSVKKIDSNNVIYNGLQMKLWNESQTLSAHDLGTFLDVIFNNFSNDSKGYLYYTCKIGKTFHNNCLRKNKIIPIHIENPFLEKETNFYNFN
jgi:hypothetical protein